MLGVSRKASQDEIRKAYLKLAHKYHPDKTGGDKAAEDKLKEVNAAYDVLKNTEKRSQYDQFGSTDGSNPFAGGGFGGGGAGGFDAPFEDLFDMFFGQGGGSRGRRRSGARPGSDLEYTMQIDLKEAAHGTTKKIRYSRKESCADCSGTGAASGSRPDICPGCRGTGQVRSSQGILSVARVCPQCRGAGKIITKPCHTCNGNGQKKTKRELSVDVPAGIDSGQRLHFQGEGEGGTGGGPRGDLYVRIQVQAHPLFEREGATLFCEVPLSITEAALGTTLRVPTLNGHIDLKVPAGTQSGDKLRLRGQGLPEVRGYYQGDQIVQVFVETPKKLSRRQKELMKELQESYDPRAHPRRKKFERLSEDMKE
jgi:molecular chaperone DnaJ